MKDICSVLQETSNIAIVGLSDKPGRVSGEIGQYLIRQGYNLAGVHPNLDDVFGIKVYKNLKEVHFKPDIVDVFLDGAKVPAVLPDILEVKPKYVWFQLGVHNDEAVEKMEKEGIVVIQNRCIKIEHGMCR